MINFCKYSGKECKETNCRSLACPEADRLEYLLNSRMKEVSQDKMGGFTPNNLSKTDPTGLDDYCQFYKLCPKSSELCFSSDYRQSCKKLEEYTSDGY